MIDHKSFYSTEKGRPGYELYKIRRKYQVRLRRGSKLTPREQEEYDAVRKRIAQNCAKRNLDQSYDSARANLHLTIEYLMHLEDKYAKIGQKPPIDWRVEAQKYIGSRTKTPKPPPVRPTSGT